MKQWWKVKEKHNSKKEKKKKKKRKRPKKALAVEVGAQAGAGFQWGCGLGLGPTLLEKALGGCGQALGSASLEGPWSASGFWVWIIRPRTSVGSQFASPFLAPSTMTPGPMQPEGTPESGGSSLGPHQASWAQVGRGNVSHVPPQSSEPLRVPRGMETPPLPHLPLRGASPVQPPLLPPRYPLTFYSVARGFLLFPWVLRSPTRVW